MASWIVLALLCIHSAAAFKSYAGFSVLEVQTPNERVVTAVNEFVEAHPESNMWLEPVVGGHAHVMLSREDRELLERVWPASSVFVEDVEALVRASMRRSGAQQSWFEEYHPLDELNRQLFDLVEKFGAVPGLDIESFELGQSWENRTIYGLKFSGTNATEKIAWNGAIHAREWIAPATVHYVTNELLEGYANGDPRVVNILDNIEFHVVPVLNVDGYDYTWTTNRMWRKTRSTYNAPQAYGTDPNRNWDFHWCEEGASTNPSSDTYCGPFPQSEPEIDAWAKYIGELTDVHGYIDWHSYGQYILSPWGWTSELTFDNADLVGLSSRMNTVMEPVNNNRYTVGPSGITLYPVSGGGKDYTYAVDDVKYSYTIELPGNPGGFVLPPEFILPVGRECWNGVLVFCEQIINEFGG